MMESMYQKIPPDNAARVALICTASPPSIHHSSTLAWRLCIVPGPTLESRDRDEPRLPKHHGASLVHKASKDCTPCRKRCRVETGQAFIHALGRSTFRVTISTAHSMRACARTRAKPKCDRLLSRALHSPVRRTAAVWRADRWSKQHRDIDKDKDKEGRPLGAGHG